MSFKHYVFHANTSDGVSPVVGVILIVAVTVILAAVIGAVVFDLGQSTSANPQAGVTSNENADGSVDVTLIEKSNADTVYVRAEDGSLLDGDLTLGESVTVPADMSATVVGVLNGKEAVLQTVKAGPAPSLPDHYLVVAQDGSGDYQQINTAKQNAVSGDIIYVKDGTYDETVTITTSNITIRGESQNAVVNASGQVGVEIRADGVTIDTLTAQSEGTMEMGMYMDGHAYYVNGTDSTTITNVDFKTSTDADSYLLVEDSTNLSVDGASGHRLELVNTQSDALTSNSVDTLDLNGASITMIEDNNIGSSYVEYSTTVGTMQDNTLSSVVVSDSSTITKFDHNDVVGSSSTLLSIDDSSNVSKFTNNLVNSTSGNSRSVDIYGGDLSGMTFTDNVFLPNNEEAVLVRDSEYVTPLSGTLDVADNYWGDGNEPVAGDNSDYFHDSTNGSIDASTWLTEIPTDVGRR